MYKLHSSFQNEDEPLTIFAISNEDRVAFKMPLRVHSVTEMISAEDY